MPRPTPIPRLAWVLGFALLAAAAAWAVFSRLPPMLAQPVRVGGVPVSSGALVPLGYQLSVFPAFGAFLGALAVDLARGDERQTVAPRAALVAITGLAAVPRLAGATGATGALALSGHAFFLFAVLAYELAPPAGRDTHAHVSLALVIPALLVVGWYKVVVWGDAGWFGVSAALGCALGVALARLART